jgi:hypothetical protein
MRTQQPEIPLCPAPIGQPTGDPDLHIVGYYGFLMYKVRGLVLVVYIRNALW